MQELRLLQEKDLESMYPIYVHYVKTSVAIFDLVPDSFNVFKENHKVIFDYLFKSSYMPV